MCFHMCMIEFHHSDMQWLKMFISVQLIIYFWLPTQRERTLDNLGVMTVLFEMVDSGCHMDTNSVGEPQSATVSATTFMDSSG